MKSLKLHTILILFSISFIDLIGQNDTPLFETNEPLKIVISTSLREITNDLKEREQRPAQLIVKNENGTEELHQIKIRVRGVTRAKKEVCQFPPLRLNFKKKQTKNTVFEGQDKLKLVTHCINSNNYSQNALKEYLAYKLFEVITPYSFKTRLCEITYIDTLRNNRTTHQLGFLIEDIDDLAKRNGLKEFDGRIVNQEALQKETLDKMVFFQYLIGNLDWAVPNRHNMKVLAGKEKELPIGIPYDFDYSGWVNTSYATPPDVVKISSVRTRVFRGLCRINNYSETLVFYKKIRPQLEKTLIDVPFLTDKSRNYITKYLNNFYDILNDPNRVRDEIIRACRAEHEHTYSK
ncbi:hypothetical protein [Urechidicola vernalis]|uniref:Uncharacterized protein n=1 Tax=Urechidicola vernalis TaxID=3075600 RepID=A0ABU2Y5U9_9FLAO|nr:hypothetical protein [Urechidicola sp. P050]MDT0553422.1 hypothetical protein [Urechidicola sp. P050]